MFSQNLNSMKWFLMIVLLVHNGLAYTQPAPADQWADSVHVVGLRELALSSKAKSQTDRLSDFYRGNLASTLEEVLARLPEVNMVKRGSYGLEPTLRSFSGSQLNVLVDGMRIHGACTDKMDPATIYIEPENLGSLEVQTGNRGFVAGSAIGGSFNFKIAEPTFSNGRLNGMLSSGFHSVSKGLYESLALNYGSSKFAIRASGTYRKHQNYRAGGGKEIPFSQYEKVNYSVGTKIDLGNDFSLRTDFIGDDGFNIGYPALPMDVGYASARIGAVTLQKKSMGRFSDLKLKVYGNYVRHFMDDSHRPNVHMHMDMPGTSRTTGFFGETNLHINKKSSLQLRLDGSSTKLYASMTMYQDGTPPMYMLTWPDNRRNQWGASATWNLAVKEKWLLRFSGRSDIFTTKLSTQESKNHVQIFSNRVNGTNDITANFSAEATRVFNKRWRLSGSAGFAQRMPSASEQYGFYLFNASDGYDYIGNPELNTESAINSEMALQFRKGNSRLKLSGFTSVIKNYITAYEDPSLSIMTYGANGVKRYTNEKEALLAGFEGSAIVPLTKTVSYVTTLRYIWGRNASGDPLPGITPLKNAQTIQWSKKNLSVKLENFGPTT
ncbi:MAG: TonB-dependent receptor [Chitinophagaceae bacterium]|nr:MAG: TonB-dependent receptor [Chitinophagaceae bacterium]